MKKIDVCFSPDLIHQYNINDRCVVVIDVLRATSCMVAGLGSGVKSITPVATVAECEALGKKGYLMAGERGGIKLPQFDLGNSPFEYMEARYKGKRIATTTTNGTRCIELSKDAPEVIIGAFLNLKAIIDHLNNQSRDVLLFCAAWQGKFNLEDSLFAGAVCNGLKKNFEMESDAAVSAFHLHQSMSHDIAHYISRSSHASRLTKFKVDKDISYCSKEDEFNVVPKLKEGLLSL